eukprot:1155105-Pelagomonas_calceolata.AAC.2
MQGLEPGEAGGSKFGRAEGDSYKGMRLQPVVQAAPILAKGFSPVIKHMYASKLMVPRRPTSLATACDPCNALRDRGWARLIKMDHFCKIGDVILKTRWLVITPPGKQGMSGTGL